MDIRPDRKKGDGDDVEAGMRFIAELGAEGWEAIGMVSDMPHPEVKIILGGEVGWYRVLFKRPPPRPSAVLAASYCHRHDLPSSA